MSGIAVSRRGKKANQEIASGYRPIFKASGVSSRICGKTLREIINRITSVSKKDIRLDIILLIAL
ncbi:MAG: hypothetical protein KatS3mg031_2353 [Chitinophagales bacterium]|nr:MAG: hypothetical protein KatS3mg031_2353 [Chitinophagales bacterium]